MTLLHINGQPLDVEVSDYDSLADVLHERLHMYGTRVSCAEGECGCCTVLMDGVPATACLVLARQAEGRSITTIEGLGSPDSLHPVQQAFIDEHGFQCAYCTPGFIMAATYLLEHNPSPTRDDVAEGLSGNLCRCGAYPFIIQAVLTAAERMGSQR
jgi:aerobic-type carbon monoxide dehydrogenase small subunit (CoxS/CutS family)